MNLTRTPIKDGHGNVYGAKFRAASTGEESSSGSASQTLTPSSLGAGDNPSFVNGSLYFSKNLASAMVSFGYSTLFSFEVIDAPNKLEPERSTALVKVSVRAPDQSTFSKSYYLHEWVDHKWVETREPGSYSASGFTITMPTKMGQTYIASIHGVGVPSNSADITINLVPQGASDISVSATSKYLFEDKSAGFTAHEIKYLERAIPRLEGKVDHMYLDTKGQVTIGAGFMIPSEDAAVGYALLDSDDNEATDAQKRAEWRSIKSMTKGHTAGWYEDYTDLYMTGDAIDARTDSLISTTFRELKNIFKNFGDYPSAARVALQDMKYNLGDNFGKFVNLAAAVRRQDWVTAANESHRLDIDESRNDEIRELFLKAARDEQI